MALTVTRPSFRPSPRVLAWGPVVVALLIAVLAGWGVSTLRSSADTARRVEVTIVSLHLALELAPGTQPPLGTADPLARLQALHPRVDDDARLNQIVADVRDLAGSLMPQPGDGAGRSREIARVESAFTVLQHEQDDKATRATLTSRVATIALVIFATGAVILLLRRFDRLRRRDAERHNAELRALTYEDTLTGLANRRRLERDLPRAITAATRERPLTFTMFDLDGFKAYNDTFGHHGGDELLKRLGSSAQLAARSYGNVYRLGGDEFCAVLPWPAGEADAEACREALGEHGDGFSITASAGSVRIPEEARDMTSALKLADARMYAHKGGRRRRPATPVPGVCTCGACPPAPTPA